MYPNGYFITSSDAGPSAEVRLAPRRDQRRDLPHFRINNRRRWQHVAHHIRRLECVPAETISSSLMCAPHPPLSTIARAAKGPSAGFPIAIERAIVFGISGTIFAPPRSTSRTIGATTAVGSRHPSCSTISNAIVFDPSP